MPQAPARSRTPQRRRESAAGTLPCWAPQRWAQEACTPKTPALSPTLKQEDGWTPTLPAAGEQAAGADGGVGGGPAWEEAGTGLTRRERKAVTSQGSWRPDNSPGGGAGSGGPGRRRGSGLGEGAWSLSDPGAASDQRDSLAGSRAPTLLAGWRLPGSPGQVVLPSPSPMAPGVPSGQTGIRLHL